MAASSPNILLILTDQQRRDATSVYPGGLATTPHLADLASGGTVFDHVYTTCPICAPARASLQTGLFPAEHGMTNNIYQPGCTVHELPDSPQLLARRLAAAGYATGYTGKWHLGWGRDSWSDPRLMQRLPEIDRHLRHFEYPPEYAQADGLPSRRGYAFADDFPGHGGGGHAYPAYEEYLENHGLRHEVSWIDADHGEVTSGVDSTVDAFLADRTLTHLEALRQTGRPWFHTLAFWGPHEPCLVPAEFLEPYRHRHFAPWPNFEHRGGPNVGNSKRQHSGWEKVENGLRYYLAHADLVDAMIGRVFEFLRQTGQWEETVVIFTSDHGDARGCQGGLRDKGSFLYEEVVAVPCIVRDPASSHPRARATELFSLADLYSTILDCAGCASNEAYSLRKALRVPGGGRSRLVVQTDALAGVFHSSRLLRRDAWAYLFHADGREEIYDLESDPWQLANRVDDPALRPLHRQMREELIEELRKNRDLLADALPTYFANAPLAC